MGACAYRDGDMNGKLYDSNGNVCTGISSTEKILIIAGSALVGVVFLGTMIWIYLRWSRARARNALINVVPARPLSAWAHPPGTMASDPRSSRHMFDAGEPNVRRNSQMMRGYSETSSVGDEKNDYAPLQMGHSDNMPYNTGAIPASPVNRQNHQLPTFAYNGQPQSGTQGMGPSIYAPSPRQLPIPANTYTPTRYSTSGELYDNYAQVDRSPSPSPSPERQQHSYFAGAQPLGSPISPSEYYSQRKSYHDEYSPISLHNGEAEVLADAPRHHAREGEEELSSFRAQARDRPQSQSAYLPHRLSTVEEKRRSVVYSQSQNSHGGHIENGSTQSHGERYAERRISFIPVLGDQRNEMA